MPTLKDVATVAGVSVATVSHVINETRYVSPDTRARVKQAASQLGYVPDAAGRQLALLKSGKQYIAPPAGASPSASPGQTFSPLAADGDIRLAGKTSEAETPSLKSETDSGNTGKAAHNLLRLLRAAQPISRVELARRLNLNRSTVTDTFKPLIAAGLVLDEPGQTPASESRVQGRPSSNLSFNSERDFFVGVNIGVRHSQVGLTTLGGEILAEDDFETPAEATRALALIRASIERLCDGVPPARKLRVIGVSVAGPTDAARRQVLYAPHLGWHDVNIADALRFDSSKVDSNNEERATGGGIVPVVVENDATASAIYESRLRLRKATAGDDSLNNFILVRSGTGIGVGLVLNGEVYRGTGQGAGIAGEFGHMTIVAGGKPCACGNRGCWERYASAASASALYMGDRTQLGGMTAAPRYVEIVARAEGGELRAKRTLERVGEYLGIGIGNVIMGLGVPHVIVSGRIVYGWKLISEPLHQAVAQSMAGQLKGWTIEPGEPSGAGLGGALEVAVEEFLMSGFEV